MNKTKKIYFLSAIVMILGCYVLNLSYSLFVQTEEKDVVTSTVPTITTDLSITSLNLEANKEYVIKEKIKNTSKVSINYGLIATSNDNFSVSVVNTANNNIYGSLNELEEKDIYLKVSNLSDKDIVVDFKLDSNYTTLNYDIDNYLKINNINSVNKYDIEYSNELYENNKESLQYKIINKYINEINYNKTNILPTIETILKSRNIVELPINPELDIDSNIESNLYKTEDNYGVTYYYKGNVNNNYVLLADKLWRIVRINGNDTVRLILDDTIGLSKFNSLNNDNAYVGYTYGDVNSSSYELTHKNVNNSVIKNTLDNFYSTELINYNSIVKDSYCGNKGIIETYLGYGKNETLYKYTSNDKTLICSDLDYSKYELNIGLLSAEELYYATSNKTETYLNNGTNWWTMTPYSFDNNSAKVVGFNSKTGIEASDVENELNVRPVINIKNNVTVTGTGTKEDPYVIK